jgi:hypothetical protein
MPNSDSAVDEVQVGDRVAYRLSTGEHARGACGKVMGIFNTQDGQTLADVEWETLGPPRRLSITSLTKV